VAKNIKIEKEIEERCKNHVAMYEDRLNKLEEAIAKKPDIEKVKSMIDNNKTDETTGAKAAESEKQAIDALEEYKESIARRNNSP
jgi:tyrosyl-tRNA synthetase